MKIKAWNKVGQDWVATDSVGHVIGVIRRIPMLESIKPDNASKTMLDRLNELPSSNLIRMKTDIPPAS
jgi:hypothetical protein